MNATPRFAVAAHVRTALLLIACLSLFGCAPMLVQVLKQDPQDPEQFVRVQPTELAGAATLLRGGRALPLRLPYQLQPGDVIQTGPDAVAQIRLPEGHEIVLDVNTRVRLGSFLVEFGRILARARGFFEAESENVVAGVEGTEFAFQVPRDRSVLITVLDGAVVCRSKTNSWAPVRLRRGERFESSPYAALPDKRLATAGELEDIRRWIRRVEGSVPAWPVPERDGYCCADGRVFEASRKQCRGRFFAERGAADESCRPSKPDLVYCCSDGEVFRAARERCRGDFYLEQAEAERACRRARPGYCCADGRVFEANREQCRGRYFAERGAADEYCRPRPETGYCCADGQIFDSTRERCRGNFYLEQAEAERACRRARPGYCCADGRVFEASREQCRGRFFAERGAADESCRPRPETGYCCSDEQVFDSTREQCKGSFHLDRGDARNACQPRTIDPRRQPPRLHPIPYEIITPKVPSTPDIK